MGCREPLFGVRRSKRQAELTLELPTEIISESSSDGTFAVKRKGISDQLIPHPDGVNGMGR